MKQEDGTDRGPGLENLTGGDLIWLEASRASARRVGLGVLRRVCRRAHHSYPPSDGERAKLAASIVRDASADDRAFWYGSSTEDRQLLDEFDAAVASGASSAILAAFGALHRGYRDDDLAAEARQVGEDARALIEETHAAKESLDRRMNSAACGKRRAYEALRAELEEIEEDARQILGDSQDRARRQLSQRVFFRRRPVLGRTIRAYFQRFSRAIDGPRMRLSLRVPETFPSDITPRSRCASGRACIEPGRAGRAARKSSMRLGPTNAFVSSSNSARRRTAARS